MKRLVGNSLNIIFSKNEFFIFSIITLIPQQLRQNTLNMKESISDNFK